MEVTSAGVSVCPGDSGHISGHPGLSGNSAWVKGRSVRLPICKSLQDGHFSPNYSGRAGSLGHGGGRGRSRERRAPCSGLSICSDTLGPEDAHDWELPLWAVTSTEWGPCHQVSVCSLGCWSTTRSPLRPPPHTLCPVVHAVTLVVRIKECLQHSVWTAPCQFTDAVRMPQQ